MLQLSAVATCLLLTSCASVSRREGAEAVENLLAQRVPSVFSLGRDTIDDGSTDARVTELLGQPLTMGAAQQIAQLRNPVLSAEYARLGIAQADVVEASRIGNPTLFGSALKDTGPSKITTGISLPFGDILLMRAKRRFAEGEYDREQLRIAGSLFTLSMDIRQAWYEAAAADQVAAMRKAVAVSARNAEQLAQRYYTAGNISLLEFKIEQAAASQAQISAISANAAARHARLALNTHMGLSGVAAAQWTLELPLSTPPDHEDDASDLVSMAQQNRLDLMSARREVNLLDDALGLARHWRLLGSVDIGIERESETDGSKLTGPSISLALPLFNQGQAAIARAEAHLEVARAGLEQRSAQIDNEVRLGVERIKAMREIAEQYRSAVIPQREAIVKEQGARINYMLIGAFELLLAKQQEFDAYQSYLESIRDYWLARVNLARAIGTQLPSDAQPTTPTIGVDDIVHPGPDPHGGHQHHIGAGDSMPGMDQSEQEISTMTPLPAQPDTPHAVDRDQHPDVHKTPDRSPPPAAGDHPPEHQQAHDHNSPPTTGVQP